MKEFTWKGEVRAHEIDAQGIVNNAYYFTYFDHARTLQLKEIGFDWVKLSQEGFNFVLVSANIKFLNSLRPFQTFTITSSVVREGRIKLVFNQSLVNLDNILVCTGVNTVVCVDSRRNKPIDLSQIFENRVFAQ